MDRVYKKLREAKYLPHWFPDIISQSAKKRLIGTYRTIVDLECFRETGPDKFDFSTNAAQDLKNRSFNRYCDIIPFDHNRVILNGEQDYINASYLSSIGNHKKYIVSQGPLVGTCADFWQMAWEQNTGLILMLTPERENGKIKCERYWPKQSERESFKTNNLLFTVTNVLETALMDGKTIQRTFEVLNHVNNQTRQVQMLHFLEWPDHQSSDVSSILELINLTNRIHKQMKTQNPEIGHLLVHCSAGCGRTGTFCTIDSVSHHLSEIQTPIVKYQLENMKEYELEVLPQDDIIALTVNHFRKQRVSAVQSISQFVLCYEAILMLMDKWYNEGIPPKWEIE